MSESGGETMKAGRELDAEIAEKVMGLPVQWREVRRVASAGGNYRELVGTPHYSTDIAAAWEVVNAMIVRGYSIIMHSKDALVSDEFGIFAKDWKAGFEDWRAILPENMNKDCEFPHLPSGGAGGETLPLAICLAALASLKAVETTK